MRERFEQHFDRALDSAREATGPAPARVGSGAAEVTGPEPRIDADGSGQEVSAAAAGTPEGEAGETAADPTVPELALTPPPWALAAALRPGTPGTALTPDEAVTPPVLPQGEALPALGDTGAAEDSATAGTSTATGVLTAQLIGTDATAGSEHLGEAAASAPGERAPAGEEAGAGASASAGASAGANTGTTVQGASGSGSAALAALLTEAPSSAVAAPVAVSTPSSVPTAPPAATTSQVPVATQVQQQIGAEMSRLVSRGDGSHRLTLTLSPEALGDVRVTLTVRAGAVHVSFAAGDEAQRALLESTPELRRLLELSGATESRIQVRDLTSPSLSTLGQGTSDGGTRDPSAGAPSPDADLAQEHSTDADQDHEHTSAPGAGKQPERPATDGTERGTGALRTPLHHDSSRPRPGVDLTA